MDRRTALGVGLVVVSAVGYGSGSILAAPIYATGVDWLTLVYWRFLIGAALGWIWVLMSAPRRAAVRRLPRRQLGVALGLGAMFTGNAGTYYAGLQTVPAALAGVLVYTYPVIVAVLSLRFATRSRDGDRGSRSGSRSWARFWRSAGWTSARPHRCRVSC